MQHPRNMGASEVEAFLTMLAAHVLTVAAGGTARPLDGLKSLVS